MRLQPKVLSIFAAALVLMLGFAVLAFPSLVSRVSEAQLFSLARTLGAYVVHDLETQPFAGDTAAFEKALDQRFEFAQRLGEGTGDYLVRSVALIGPDFKVEVGHPNSEIGADYSGHADVREEMATGNAGDQRIALESSRPGGPVTDADILTKVRLADGDSRVLEIKLDFSGTLAMLTRQYARLQAAALGLIAAGLIAVTIALASLLRGTVLRPLLRISKAMELVGKGDLAVSANVRSRDEIGQMGEHFDTMVAGLRERFELERYVSRSTLGAARDPAARDRAEGTGSAVERRRLAVLFSDVRGFTAYSECADPARVVSVLNLILGAQEEIIAKAGGEVDKFVGDEVMAVFERPALAIAAALVIRSKMARISGQIDGLSLGYGIHVGELVQGDIGSPARMDHTVIGDTVNTASRLQAASGAGQIIVSAEVAADPEVASRFVLDELGPLKVKGKEQPLSTFTVRGAREPAKDEIG
ncbi:MAG TPA: adenylate/guanylate cyclase domain-containing protein [Rectinemataceae bacterium]|nr:adenylate/guanylate cyclase domain-containing protein [Rectinemataceae bacterium]